MSDSRTTLLFASVATVLVSGVLLLVVVGYAALVVLSALGTGRSVVDVLLELAFPYLPIAAVLAVVVVVSGLGVVWGLARRASAARSERLQAIAERVERENDTLRKLGLSEALAPPEPSAEERAENALEELKAQYVRDEIDEAEFERKLDRLVANESVDDARAARERRSVLDDHAGDRPRRD